MFELGNEHEAPSSDPSGLPQYAALTKIFLGAQRAQYDFSSNSPTGDLTLVTLIPPPLEPGTYCQKNLANIHSLTSW